MKGILYSAFFLFSAASLTASPLTSAIEKGNRAVIDLLIARGADLKAPDL